jgi:alkylation response protein AidB-like acyl-CoA dehydrogenase
MDTATPVASGAQSSEILDLSGDLVAFRAAVREWTHRTAPPEMSDLWLKAKGLEQVEIQQWWMRERDKVGLAIGHWPKAYGGADLGLAHEIIIADEFAKADAPSSNAFVISMNHVPATLIPYGTERQKTHYLPGVAQGTIWCQGFSEPGAGSDLASLKTRAERDGDHYVINGQKIWSSWSMYASHAILLARTDFEAKKQRGITYFLLDMKAPGVEVRPIRKSTGHSNFAEVFLSDVRIPVEDRVGEENQGWTVAQATLAAERGVLMFERVEREHAAMLRYYRRAIDNGAPWMQEPELRRQFMRIFADFQALRRLIRVLLREDREEGRWSMTPSLVKWSSTKIANRLGELRVRLEGMSSQIIPEAGPEAVAMYDFLDTFGGMIAGGSNEIMRNLIAERALGMPR